MKDTKYNQVKSTSKAFNTLKTSFFIMLAVTTIVSVGSIYLVRSAYKDALNRVYVREGKQTYTARVSYDLEERKFDVEGHIEDFYLNMFAFDQHNFERNINRALALIGNDGKIIYQGYKEQDLYKQLVQNNITVYIEFEEIMVNMEQEPYGCEVKAKQYWKSGQNLESQHLNARFEVVDKNIGRSSENKRGLMIENFVVYDNSPVEISTF